MINLNITMKYVSTFLISAFTISATMAQSTEIAKDTTVTVSTDRYEVVTNRFFDNWFIGAGAGAQFYYGDHNKQMNFGDRLVPAFEFYIGKWFTPGIGTRIALNGFKNLGVTQNGSHSTGEVYDASQWLEKQEFNYYNVHADVLFNLHHLLSGYRQDRKFTTSPYVGLGWMVTKDEPTAREISANLGIYNSLRLSKKFDVTLDLRGSMVNDRFDGELGARKTEGMLTAALGLAYRFKERTWEKPTTTVISYSEAELNALREEVAELAADNDALRKLIADAKSETITDVKIEKSVLASPILVTFPINKSIVSNEARVNLGFFAKAIKENKSDVVYKVTGYADKGTGNPQINERLSRERADAIFNVLVNEFDVPASRLIKDHKGGVENMFYNDPRVSRAVIVIAE